MKGEGKLHCKAGEKLEAWGRREGARWGCDRGGRLIRVAVGCGIGGWRGGGVNQRRWYRRVDARYGAEEGERGERI